MKRGGGKNRGPQWDYFEDTGKKLDSGFLQYACKFCRRTVGEMENNRYEDEETWENPEDAPELPAENDPHWPQDILTGIRSRSVTLHELFALQN